MLIETTRWCQYSASGGKFKKSGKIFNCEIHLSVWFFHLLVSCIYTFQTSGQYSSDGQKRPEEMILELLHQPSFLWVPLISMKTIVFLFYNMIFEMPRFTIVKEGSFYFLNILSCALNRCFPKVLYQVVPLEHLCYMSPFSLGTISR